MALPKKIINSLAAVGNTAKISIKLAYGLISLAVVCGLLFFAASSARLNAESLPAPAVLKSQPAVFQLTDQALKLQAENFTETSVLNASQVTKFLTERKKKLLLLMDEPEEALLYVLPEKARQMFNKNDQDLIEKTVSLKGTYSVVEADFGALAEPKTYYSLETVDSTYNLHFAGDVQNLQSGAQVAINEAIVLGDEALVAELDSGGKANASQIEAMDIAATATFQQKTAVILFNFSDDTREPMTTDQVRSAIFTASNSVNAYYSEATYDNIGFIGRDNPLGDVYGWFTIPTAYPKTVFDCNDYFDWTMQADEQAIAAGADLKGYDKNIYIMPLLLSGFSVCPWAGMAMGESRLLINGAPNYVNTRIIAHELGHNFFLGHSSSRRCYDASGNVISLSNNCTVAVYGDPFDIMGSAVIPRQFQAQNKYVLGVLGSENSVDASAGGTFTLSPTEQLSAGIQRLYLRRGTSEPLIIEFRQPYGTFDNFSPADPAVNGLLIRTGYLTGSGTRLLDMTPSTPNDNFLDAALPVGQSFLDEIYGYNITTVSVSASGAVVEVQKTAAACQNSPATASVTPESQTGEPGSTQNYTISVTNRDTSACPNVVYILNGILPAGFMQTVLPLYLVLAPGETKEILVSVTAPSSAEAGAYTIAEEIKNVITGEIEAIKNMTMIIYQEDATPPSAVNNLIAP
jgi:hypothetical protein